MANPKTKNLGLNKIDRTSPATTYFDLEKYIDQNADSIDQFAGGVNETLTDVRQRLDTEQRKEVVLNAGMQILNAERSTVFSLSGIKGRTLVNQLGRAGACETLDGWPSVSPISIDPTMRSQGNSSLKATISSGEGYVDIYRAIRYDKTKHYIAVGDVKVFGGAEARIRIIENLNPSSEIPSAILKGESSNFSTLFFRVPAGAITGPGVVYFGAVFVGSPGSGGNLDALRLYEISADEYVAIGNMKPEKVAAKYPYFNSVQPVRNPYANRYGENLVPPFYEWVISDEALILHPYHLSLTPTGEYKGTYISVPCLPDTTYTLQGTVSGNGKLYADVRDASEGHTYHLASGGFVTFTTSNNSTGIDIIVTNDTTLTGAMEFKDISLVLGSTPKTFKPREDSMLALKTELYADPITGKNADEVFEKDGQFFKLAKWKGVVLDGSVSLEGSTTGFKRLKFPITGAVSSKGDNSWVVKYDGSLVPYGDSNSMSSVHHIIASQGGLFLSTPNIDSGWGDSYTPTADEIRAYFMGWVMFNGSASVSSGSVGPSNPPNNFYNGIGTKAWARRNGVNYADGTTVLPTKQAGDFIPYKLVYQLAKPTVEPIVSEGMITFNEGDNQIEVGAGIVLRERAEPQESANYYNINASKFWPAGKLEDAVGKLLQVYKNSNKEPWEFLDDPSYGKYARLRKANYDPAATYSVTYLMLENSPTVPFNGSYADNEKAILLELTNTVQQNATAVSLLMNKKAENDVFLTPWITPTLTNGWTNYGGTEATAAYRKTSYGEVRLKGTIKGGALTAVAFILPLGFRPPNIRRFAVDSNQSPAFVEVYPSGAVALVAGSNAALSLEQVSFLVGQ